MTEVPLQDALTRVPRSRFRAKRRPSRLRPLFEPGFPADNALIIFLPPHPFRKFRLRPERTTGRLILRRQWGDRRLGSPPPLRRAPGLYVRPESALVGRRRSLARHLSRSPGARFPRAQPARIYARSALQQFSEQIRPSPPRLAVPPLCFTIPSSFSANDCQAGPRAEDYVQPAVQIETLRSIPGWRSRRPQDRK